nr:uncharacterized protein LOC127314169 [Lolium perenne]
MLRADEVTHVAASVVFRSSLRKKNQPKRVRISPGRRSGDLRLGGGRRGGRREQRSGMSLGGAASCPSSAAGLRPSPQSRRLGEHTFIGSSTSTYPSPAEISEKGTMRKIFAPLMLSCSVCLRLLILLVAGSHNRQCYESGYILTRRCEDIPSEETKRK